MVRFGTGPWDLGGFVLVCARVVSVFEPTLMYGKIHWHSCYHALIWKIMTFSKLSLIMSQLHFMGRHVLYKITCLSFLPAHAPFNANPIKLQEESDNLVFFFKCYVISKCEVDYKNLFHNLI